MIQLITNKYSIFLMAIILLVSLSYATDPFTTATATVNGSTYAFESWINASVTVNLVCNAGNSSCAGMRYCVDTANICDPISTGTPYTGTINISTEGTSFIRYSSNNSAGSWGDVNSSTVKIDTTNPSILITDDASGNWTKNDKINVTVTDSGSGISETKWIVRADNSCTMTQDNELDIGTVGTSLEANNDTLYQGKYICFRTKDNIGNKNYSMTTQISHLDTVNPTTYAGGNKTINSQFTQDATCFDSGSGIMYYNWTQVSGSGTLALSTPYSEDTRVSAVTDGTYVLGLNCTDNTGNSAYDIFTFNWDTVAPTLNILDPGTSTYPSKTITATTSDGTLSMAMTRNSICDNSLSFVSYELLTFNFEIDNGNKICYKAVDNAGNIAYSLSNEITGITSGAPVITLNGNDTITIEVHEIYTDLGATASDNYDGDITSKIIVNNTVNANMIGNYTVTYAVVDSIGKATRAIRIVYVVDTTKPIITLIGNSTVNINLNNLYTDAGATASDNYDGYMTSKIITDNLVNTSKVGVYSITYDVTDLVGNKATRVTRTVTVIDSLFPILVAGGVIGVTIIGIVIKMVFNKPKKDSNSRFRRSDDY
ncbi:MAG: DUF5011 domain-containing protein [Candidatus Micrarchaeota archaeon]|nr:DUF5011 domain-containing protein [Candidatus Micrarchaeota archaeon]